MLNSVLYCVLMEKVSNLSPREHGTHSQVAEMPCHNSIIDEVQSAQ